MRKFLAVTTLIAGLAGCATVGVSITEEQLSQLKIGESTEADVLSRFGQPTVRTRMGDGSVLLSYGFFRTQFGGYTSTTASLRFGADGKLLDTTSSTTSPTGAGAPVK